MATKRLERRLTAVLAADVAGYSRLMAADEEGTLAHLKSHRRSLVDPKIKQHRGRIVKTTGDGMLVEFASVVDAVRCAIDVQRGMAARNEAVPQEKRIEFRVGINVGDIIIDGSDIYGDGVNVAARLEGIAEPGGIFISRPVYDQIDGKLALSFRELGPRSLKNIAKPVEVFAIDRLHKSDDAPELARAELTQKITYCRAPDGVRLAYAVSGNGPTLLKAANWMNHLEYDWESPIWRHVFHGLSRNHTLIRHDARGNGMSDWDVGDLSLGAWVSDLETVADAAGVERFPLLGMSQGCAIAVAYAVRHPERVTHLLLYGGFALGGKKRSPAEKERRNAMMTLMRLGWGADDPTFRQMFTGLFIPGGTHEQAGYFNELQLRTTSPECAARYFDVVGDFDITRLLCEVKAPTLVMHVRDDLVVPIEAGRQLAAGIPGARFIAFQGRNHLFLQHEPASARFFEEIRLFLGA
ncbi:Adenylate cyclase, class 3 [Rhizobiales bacterium GAS113]|nr:Adenylate cyclase, class 3 [Rhizobiales bacterium GAS113]